MADTTRIPMDQRNPFAAWGIEEVKYGKEASEDGSIVKLENNGFEGQLTEDTMYNKVVVNDSYEANPQESFFTNNDTQKYETPVTYAYGLDSEKQPEREAGEPLNYYGIQADDLKKYDEVEDGETTGGGDSMDEEDDEITGGGENTGTGDTTGEEGGETTGGGNSMNEEDDENTGTGDTTGEEGGENIGFNVTTPTMTEEEGEF